MSQQINNPEIVPLFPINQSVPDNEIDEKTVPDSPKNKDGNSLDLTSLLRNIHLLYVSSSLQGNKASCSFFTVAMFLVVVIQTFVVSRTGNVIGGFYEAIAAKDSDQFFTILYKGVIVLCFSAITFCLIKVISAILALCWREKLVYLLQSRYFSNLTYYKIAFLDTRIDNPDQRITQDVDNFTTCLASIFANCLSGPLIVIVYTYLTIIKIHWSCPLIIVGYFLIGSIINRFLSEPIAKYVYSQGKLEGEFRHHHLWVSARAEPIALAQGTNRAHTDAHNAFRNLFEIRKRIIKWEFGLSVSSNLFTYLGSIVNYVSIAIPVFLNSVYFTSGEVAENSFYCIMLISGFSTFFNYSSLFAEIFGFSNRISALFSVCDEMNIFNRNYEDPEKFQCTKKITESYDSTEIQFHNVSFFTPTNRLLAENFTHTIVPGVNYLVVGKSGAGKSSILRSLFGLWPFFKGDIIRPSETIFCPCFHHASWFENSSVLNKKHSQRTNMIFLPQTPLIPRNCTMWELITYPFKDVPQPPNEKLHQIFSRIGLEYLLMNDTKEDYENVLSRGELQKISVLRVLFFRPLFAILDESTSSMDEKSEEQCYQLLASSEDIFEMCRKEKEHEEIAINGEDRTETTITLLSVGHRRGLIGFHQKRILVQGLKMEVEDI